MLDRQLAEKLEEVGFIPREGWTNLPNSLRVYTPDLLSQLIYACGDRFSGLYHQPHDQRSIAGTISGERAHYRATESRPNADYHKRNDYEVKAATAEEATALLLIKINQK